MTSLKSFLSRQIAKLKKVLKKQIFWKILAALFMALYTSWYVQPVSTARLIKMPGFYLSFIFSFVLTMLVFWWSENINNHLNKRYPWRYDREKRLLMQTTFGLVGLAIADYTFVRLYFWAFQMDFRASGFMDIEFPMTIGLLLTLNTLYLVKEMSPTYFGNDNDNDIDEAYVKVIEAQLMTKRYLLQIEDIVCFKREGNVGYLWDHKGTLYNMNYKMEELNKILDPAIFVQVNRSEIFALSFINGVDTKNLLVLLKVPLNVDAKITKSRY